MDGELEPFFQQILNHQLEIRDSGARRHGRDDVVGFRLEPVGSGNTVGREIVRHHEDSDQPDFCPGNSGRVVIRHVEGTWGQRPSVHGTESVAWCTRFYGRDFESRRCLRLLTKIEASGQERDARGPEKIFHALANHVNTAGEAS
jgi:hypothetical protein